MSTSMQRGAAGGRKSAAELAHLWHAKERGCDDARSELIHYYSRLVPMTRQRAVPQPPFRIPVEDIEGAGTVALILAVDRFDPGRGVKPESFLITMIRGAMLECLRREDWTPRSVRQKQRMIRGAEAECTVRRSGQEPTAAEMAAHLDWDLDEFLCCEAEAVERQLISLDLPITNKEDVTTTLAEVLPAPDDVEGAALSACEREEVREYLGFLPERQRWVIVARYWGDLFFPQIAAQLGVSDSRVVQLRAQAIGRLRQMMEASV